MIENIGNLDGSLLKPASTVSLKDSPLPGFLPIGTGKEKSENYRIRYQNFAVRDPADLAELEKLETLALHNKDVYILDKKNYVFMDQMWILLQYIEKIPT